MGESHLVAKQPISLSPFEPTTRKGTSGSLRAQKSRLLTVRKKINNCIANSKKFFIGNNKDEYERQKKFILVVKLIWLIKQKTLKAILRLLNANKLVE